MNVPVYIVENSYYKQDDKFSWNEYAHDVQSVHKNSESALDVLHVIYKEATQNPGIFDVQINEETAIPYVIYRWKNAKNQQRERFVKITIRDLT
nr:MAG TPA: hypothetical protein [Caudoviricetes sp.]